MMPDLLHVSSRLYRTLPSLILLYTSVHADRELALAYGKQHTHKRSELPATAQHNTTWHNRTTRVQHVDYASIQPAATLHIYQGTSTQGKFPAATALM